MYIVLLIASKSIAVNVCYYLYGVKNNSVIYMLLCISGKDTTVTSIDMLLFIQGGMTAVISTQF